MGESSLIYFFIYISTDYFNVHLAFYYCSLVFSQCFEVAPNKSKTLFIHRSHSFHYSAPVFRLPHSAAINIAS